MTIPAAVFQAKCLKLMDEVARTGRPVVITKRGRPAAQLAPVPAALVVEPEFAPHPADDIRRHVCAVNLHRRGNFRARHRPVHAQVLLPWIASSGDLPTQLLAPVNGACGDVYTNVC